MSNLPYVVGPGQPHFFYRDSGRPGDGICAELATAAPKLLTGGYLQFMAHWLHVRSEQWSERVAGWMSGTGMDASVVEGSVTPPKPTSTHGWRNLVTPIPRGGGHG
ncbi:hypothetical protein [Nocardia acidivorans]|uniref:hypothetical protein n=1 Tax=Nocardia acidivorans TaxID=404580 RepID=UPI000AADE616|nr:hypothetical protein [Nocardia acidivorans]